MSRASVMRSDTPTRVRPAEVALLASVFFGGLAIDLSQFSPPLQVASQFLPVTEATRLGQDLFLRGAATEPWRFGALAAMAIGLTLAALLLLRGVPVRRACLLLFLVELIFAPGICEYYFVWPVALGALTGGVGYAVHADVVAVPSNLVVPVPEGVPVEPVPWAIPLS